MLHHALAGTVLAALALASHDALLAQEDRADIRYETVSPRSIGLATTYRLGIRCESLRDGSLIVMSRDEVASDRRLQSVDRPEVTRFLRRGDIITHVDGVRIDSMETYERVMHASGGRPRLRVVNRDSGAAEEWSIDALRQSMPAEEVPPPDRSPHPESVVRALLIAPTNDEKLAPVAKRSLAEVRKTLEATLPPERLEVTELLGAECDARGILRKVEEIACRERDTLFVYVVARTGFDFRYAIDIGFTRFEGYDAEEGAAPDDGQFLRLQEGDLLRRSLWEAMLMRNARLTILVTDCCDDATILNEAAAGLLTEKLPKASDDAETDPVDAEASQGWAERLLGHTGRVDVSAAAAFADERERRKSRSAWFDPERGGWFTEAWLRAAKLADQADRSEWSETLDLAARTAAENFAARKAILSPKRAGLSDTARARLQTEPNGVDVVRILDVQRDATLDHLPTPAN
jgi:hypothetical protein